MQFVVCIVVDMLFPVVKFLRCQANRHGHPSEREKGRTTKDWFLGIQEVGKKHKDCEVWSLAYFGIQFAFGFRIFCLGFNLGLWPSYVGIIARESQRPRQYPHKRYRQWCGDGPSFTLSTCCKRSLMWGGKAHPARQWKHLAQVTLIGKQS